MKKTPNLLIRQGIRKSSRQNLPSMNSNTSLSSKNDLKQNKDIEAKLKQQKRNSQLKPCTDLQKQMMKAQNLNEKQQMQIQHEAKKVVNKKVKNSQKSIENDMISMLQQQCNKLGSELERQKMQNDNLRFQIERMRQNISSLNIKLQKIYQDNSSLSKHQQDEKMQNRHLVNQINKLKAQLLKKQDQIEILRTQKTSLQQRMNGQSKYLNQNKKKLSQQIIALRESKQNLEKQLSQKQNHIQQLIQTMAHNKMQWQAYQKQLQSHVKSNLQKKGQKITKYQTDSIKLQQKLRQQQSIRKKLHDKNKQLQKQMINLSQGKKQLQDLIINYKKRINDLSILKSSNTTIMNQKIAVLNEENQKLKSQILQLKGLRKECKQKQKPMLFGSQDFQ